jgi:mono/diheme cytochrome c family protein
MNRHLMLLCFLGVTAGCVVTAIAQEKAKADKTTDRNTIASTAPADSSSTRTDGTAMPVRNATMDEKTARIEGEKRFRTNCGRCHQPPHKFPPRVMASAIRHMRVRATITDEDMRLILRYMTQ